jgi:FkbM family methyltransferase
LAPYNNFLPIVQRLLEATPIRGKGRLANWLLEGKETGVTCHPLSGLTIQLDPQQRIERLMWAGAYERGFVRMLKSFLKPGMVFLDLGANIGYFSAIAAALVGTAGQVFAFEPSPRCFPHLERNLRDFEQAAVYNCAASDTNGPRPFYLHPAENGWGSLFADRDLTEHIHVETIRLDDWAQKVTIQRLDFLKIDTEGGEYGALLGAQALLRRFRPVVVAEINSVCLARHQHTAHDVLRFLCEAGYDCKRTEEGVIATTGAARLTLAST